MKGTPPESATAGSVCIRRWRLEDVDDLHEVLLANLEHLRPWMAWVAAEPLSPVERRSKICESDARWETGEDFGYAISDDATVARQLDGTTRSPVAWDHFRGSVRSGDEMIVGALRARQGRR